MSDLPEFEFFFADAPDHDSMCDQCWYADPPGGKGEPNEDRTWADISIEYLDGIVQEYPVLRHPWILTRVPDGDCLHRQLQYIL